MPTTHLGAAVEAADAAITDRNQLRSRWLAATSAVRGWALANPAEYALLYGSPVPGYAAPQDTIAAAARTPVVLARILADGFGVGRADPPAASPRRRCLRRCARIWPGRAKASRLGVPDEVMLAGITAWIQMFGAVSFELFGQFNNVDRRARRVLRPADGPDGRPDRPVARHAVDARQLTEDPGYGSSPRSSGRLA